MPKLRIRIMPVEKSRQQCASCGHEWDVAEAKIDASELASFREKFDGGKYGSAVDCLKVAEDSLKSLPADHWRADRIFYVIQDVIVRLYQGILDVTDTEQQRPPGYKSPKENPRTAAEDDKF
jgi:hypothetical protein